MKSYINANVRTGKTLFAILYSIEKLKLNKNAKIYANFHINLKNAIYTPFMILPFSELENSLIIIDDIWSLKNAKTLIGVFANYSGKDNIEIILTGQYYSMFEKIFRQLFDYEIIPELDKTNEILYANFCKRLDNSLKFLFQTYYLDCFNPFVFELNKKVKVSTIYNTLEKVKLRTERLVIENIKEIVKDKDDLELNLCYNFGNQQKINKYYKQLCLELGFD